MTILPQKLKKTPPLRKEERQAAQQGQPSSVPSSSVGSGSVVGHASVGSASGNPLLPGCHSQPPRKIARKAAAVAIAVAAAATAQPPPHANAAGASSISSAGGQHSPRVAREELASSSRVSQEDPNNSDDENERGFKDENKESAFERRLRQDRGLHIKQMVGDGSCLFRAVADQVYGHEDEHPQVRKLCMDYMEKNCDHFKNFCTEDFEAYVARKRRPNEHGNHLELQAISEIFNRPIEIYEYNITPINVFHPQPSPPGSGMPGGAGGMGSGGGATEALNAPLRLSYHGSTHYNSVVDPFSATVGVGLGLPGLEPGLADRQLLADAMRQSDMIEIEQAMLSDKMKMTDWQRTEEDIKDQVARESYLEYVRNLEQKTEAPHNQSSSASRRSSLGPSSSASHQFPRSTSSTSVHSTPHSTHAEDQPCGSRSSPSTELPPSSRFSPKPSTSSQKREEDTMAGGGLYEELLAAGVYTEWADDDAQLAEALLLSQQSYLSDIQQRRDPADSAGSSKHH